jgi:hypothetical protein
VWAWYSRYVQNEGVRTTTRWSPALSYESASQLARGWFERVALAMDLSDGIADLWFSPGEVDGYAFVPLSAADDVAREAEAMQHCVASYGDSVRNNRSRLWSVQRAGARVATLELGFICDEPLPSITQMKGPHNDRVALEVWIAARRWAASQNVTTPPNQNELWAPFPHRRWREQWRPYWLAKRGVPLWLPLAPSEDAFRDLMFGPDMQRARRRHRRALQFA